jgi:competence ComEA-like helix-hairpin-helix protein
MLALVVAGGLGLAIGHWRRGHPDLVGTLERFDQAMPAAPSPGTRAPRARGDTPAGTSGAKPREPAPDDRSPARPGALASTPPAVRAEDAGTQATGTAPIDVNHASTAELTRLPGVGPVLAGRIVASRETTGPFSTVDELRRVPGIGPTKLDRIRRHVTAAP